MPSLHFHDKMHNQLKTNYLGVHFRDHSDLHNEKEGKIITRKGEIWAMILQ